MEGEGRFVYKTSVYYDRACSVSRASTRCSSVALLERLLIFVNWIFSDTPSLSSRAPREAEIYHVSLGDPVHQYRYIPQSRFTN